MLIAWDKARNSPQQMPAIAQVFAALRDEPIESVLAATGANAIRVLPRLAEAMAAGVSASDRLTRPRS